jgi:hypothetical protein
MEINKDQPQGPGIWANGGEIGKNLGRGNIFKKLIFYMWIIEF